MLLKTDGLVIREKGTGESDRFVTLLTRDYGVLYAFARGARSLKSEKQSGTQLFAYADFTVSRGKDAYIVTEARVREVFFKLREDVEHLALSQYFCELTGLLAPQETPAEEYLSVLLNALYLLSSGKRPQPFLKAVLELRLMSISGYMPDLVGCAKCGTYESAEMFFDRREGCLYCPDCAEHGEPLTPGVLAAMRHICFAEPKKLFSFTLSDAGLQKLAVLTEGYMHTHLNHYFKTLQFYNQIKTQ
ncbi:MAG: DNA repair protein RecO [Clostridia bacterium]|nr:DNA repair protein RecO [Clostridia bacterium]